MDSNEDPYPNPYRQKANPSQAYEITLTIEDAPGPFAVVNGYASYNIVGETCLPPRDNFAGVQRAPTRNSVPVEYRKVAANQYLATIHTDLMEAADYYGRGVCQWEFNALTTALAASGTEGETKFISHLMPDELIDGSGVTTHFWKENYPRIESSIPRDFGIREKEGESANPPPDSRNKYFTAHITARKPSP
ncbi:hypothetical protein OK348_08020 [Flavobacterium sp. MXW15]|uniref:Uncharacterized protein n=1 Tax=Xanthomonas chitinilytica TaxID=2989819 RepID=A0ABT3JV16_9XANT|nr:hypothetical protein [Xanthomonas sp. H13-6]MCW4454741.1 hypothetical protein [Flavobacterium sp. MXW15]MCW4471980.1 hypothetical protein [Xanthomonas sp. H13-6]